MAALLWGLKKKGLPESAVKGQGWSFFLEFFTIYSLYRFLAVAPQEPVRPHVFSSGAERGFKDLSHELYGLWPWPSHFCSILAQTVYPEKTGNKKAWFLGETCHSTSGRKCGPEVKKSQLWTCICSQVPKVSKNAPTLHLQPMGIHISFVHKLF